MKLKLFVYDTYCDKEGGYQLENNPELLSFDLIIGPVYPKDQKGINELGFKNHIPIVSPLSPDSRFVSSTPGYYLINPGKKVRLASTADYVCANFATQNIILLNHGTNTGDEKYLFDRLIQKLGTGKVHPYNILTEESLGLEELLKRDMLNIFILAEGSEANVSVAMTRLNTISKSCQIKVIGLQEYTKMQSVDIEYLHNINLHYLAPYFIDYGNSKVSDFIGKYRLAFGSEPTPYSFQGYDIAMHFISMLRKAGKNFPVTNPVSDVELLQSEYSFQKLSNLGGYINTTEYVVEYSNSYEVLKIEKITGSHTSTQSEEKDEKNSLEQ